MSDSNNIENKENKEQPINNILIGEGSDIISGSHNRVFGGWCSINGSCNIVCGNYNQINANNCIVLSNNKIVNEDNSIIIDGDRENLLCLPFPIPKYLYQISNEEKETKI